MSSPYRARVDERRFLNHPGFHGGAYVVAYVEDTSERGALPDGNFEPRTILEIADCDNRINLYFDLDTHAGRVNSMHKLDTLISALRAFRAGIIAEFAEYDRRKRELGR
jgi:hypothetical protein